MTDLDRLVNSIEEPNLGEFINCIENLGYSINTRNEENTPIIILAIEAYEQFKGSIDYRDQLDEYQTFTDQEYEDRLDEYEKLFDKFIEYKVDLNVTFDGLFMHGKKTTPLMQVSALGLNEVFDKLIQVENIDIGAVDGDGRTALMLACIHRSGRIAFRLIETGKSKPELIDHREHTALLYAIKSMMPEIALKLIETGKSRPDLINSNGETPLNVACTYGMFEVAIRLLQTGQSNLSYKKDKSVLECAKKFFKESEFELFKELYDRKQIQQQQSTDRTNIQKQHIDYMFEQFINKVNTKRENPLFNQVYQACVSDPSSLTPNNMKIPIDGQYDLVTDFNLDDHNDQKTLESVIKLGNTCYTAEFLYNWWSTRATSGRDFTAPDSRLIVSDETRQTILAKYRNYKGNPNIPIPTNPNIQLDPRYQLEFIPIPRRTPVDPFNYTRIRINGQGLPGQELPMFLGYIPVYNPPNNPWNSDAVLTLIRELWDRRLLLTDHTTGHLQCCRVHINKSRRYWYRNTASKLNSMHQELSALLS